MQDAKFAKNSRYSLVFAAPTDVREPLNNIFLQLPAEANELALYFEATYMGRHIDKSPYVVISIS